MMTLYRRGLAILAWIQHNPPLIFVTGVISLTVISFHVGELTTGLHEDPKSPATKRLHNTIINFGSRSSPYPSYWAYLPLLLYLLILAHQRTFARILGPAVCVSRAESAA